MEEPDATLVARARAGDRAAFGTLVTRYRGEFARYAVALCGDTDLAADALQDAFIRAYHHLDSCRHPERFGSWLFRILTNRCHSLRRRQRPTIALDAAGLTSRQDPEAPLRAAEVRGMIESALARLTNRQREAFVLKYIDGRSYEEMARLLDEPVDALKMRVHRAREKMKQHLEHLL